MNTTGPSPKRLDISLEELRQLVDGALHQTIGRSRLPQADGSGGDAQLSD